MRLMLKQFALLCESLSCARSNLRYMRALAEAYPDEAIVLRGVAQIDRGRKTLRVWHNHPL